MKSIIQLYNELGEEGFNNYFMNNKVSISPKIDFSALIVKKNKGEMHFYNRDMKNEITKVSRMTFDFYEDAIDYLSKFNKEFHEGYEYHFEYVSKYSDHIIPYTKLPNNNLILLYIDTGYINNCYIDLYNHHFAQILKVDSVDYYDNIAYTGLFENQRNELVKFVSASDNERKKNYSGLNFVKFMQNINPEIKSDYYGSPFVEGFVFNVGDEKIKIIDPLFSETIKTKFALSRLEKKYDTKRIVITELFKYFDYQTVKEVFDMMEEHNERWIGLDEDEIEIFVYNQIFYKIVHKNSFKKYEGMKFIFDYDFSWKLIKFDVNKIVKKDDIYMLLYYVLFKYFTKEHTRYDAIFGTRETFDRVNYIVKKLEAIKYVS